MTRKILFLCLILGCVSRLQSCLDAHVETLSGTVTGLNGMVVLDLNGSEQITVSKDGIFQFNTVLVTGTNYAVTVSKQPAAQTCTVNDGSGVAMIDNPQINVICSSVTYSIGGAVTGLTGTLVLKNNNADPTTVTSDGVYVFKTEVAYGAMYDVAISQQPTGQICSFSGSHSGTPSANVTNVNIACTAIKHNINVLITGLTGSLTLRLDYNDGSGVVTTMPSFSSDNTYTLKSNAPYGSTYDVTIDTNPPAEFCVVTDGSGTVTNSAALISVDCQPTKIIFVTDDISVVANLGSPAAYDSTCTTSTNYPGSGTYVALLVDSSTRVACTTANCSGGVSEHVGWVIAPSTYYVNLNGDLIGKSNASGLLTITGSAISSSAGAPWTGLATDWTTGLSCLNWTSNIVTDAGIFGSSSSTSSAWYAFSAGACDSSQPVYCVEQ